MRIHEYLKVVKKDGGEKVIKCIKCGYEFCTIEENYKEYALLWKRDFKDIKLRYPISGEKPKVTYQEFICPGCGVLLEVEITMKGSPILHDIEPYL